MIDFIPYNSSIAVKSQNLAAHPERRQIHDVIARLCSPHQSVSVVFQTPRTPATVTCKTSKPKKKKVDKNATKTTRKVDCRTLACGFDTMWWRGGLGGEQRGSAVFQPPPAGDGENAPWR